MLALVGVKASDFRFSRKFSFLVPLSRGGQMPVLPPLRTPMIIGSVLALLMNRDKMISVLYLG